MLQGLVEKRNKLDKIIKQILNDPNVEERMIKESGILNLKKQMNKVSFKVALVAPFSAGKSTFVNGLIGTDLLSMDVLSETATITTLKYSKTPRIEVFNYDGTKEVYDGKTHSVVQLKNILKAKSAVNRGADDTTGAERKIVRVEETVRAVDVYWDLELCKDGLEIVDTPGLFARHKEHDDITAKVLPQADAILFLVAPDCIGERNFFNVITDYVENAKKSNLDQDGRHIFFIINKVDKFPVEEVTKARKELEHVLAPVLDRPQIFEVSSYFAMKARMYENGVIPLTNLKQDLNIIFKDKDGFVVSGRQITEDDIPTIKSVSRIESIETAIAQYFEYKSIDILKDVENSLLGIYEREISNVKTLINLLKGTMADNEQSYSEKIKQFQEKFEELQKKLLKEIDRDIHATLEGGSAGGSKIEKVIENVKKEKVLVSITVFRTRLGKYWKAEMERLTEDNSIQIVDDVFKTLLLNLETQKKSLINKSFTALQQEYLLFSNTMMKSLSAFEDDVNASLTEQLNLPEMKNQASFFNQGQILTRVSQDIERLFKETSLDIKSDLKKKIELFKLENTTYHKKKGFLNAIKGIFGKAELEKHFDNANFKVQLDKLVQTVIIDGCEEIRLDANAISKEINNHLDEVNSVFKMDLAKTIEYFEAWRKHSINQMFDELKFKKEDIAKTIDHKLILLGSLDKEYARVRRQLAVKKDRVEEEVVHAV